MVYELLIKGATVYDGLGAEPFKAEIAIAGDKIAEVAKRITGKARRTLQADGLAAAPGFVDIHSHSDYYLLINPLAESKIRQGVTTEVGGNCGYSAAPIGGAALEQRRPVYKDQFQLDLDWGTFPEYCSRLAEKKISVNFAPLVGHNTIRASVMGLEDRDPTGDELALMARQVEEAMRQGAVGLSTGLAYSPACFSRIEELVALARAASKYGRILACHIRNEGDTLLESLQEIIEVARRAKVSLQISHLKTLGKANWTKIEGAFALVEGAISEGIEVSCDRYPYNAANTGLQAVLPKWALDGGPGEMEVRLRDQNLRKRIKSEISAAHPDEEYWQSVFISKVGLPEDRHFAGKSVAQIAGEAGMGPVDFALDILLKEQFNVEAIYFAMCEQNMRQIMAKPYVMVGSDSGATAPYGLLGEGVPHPRAYGTFANAISRLCRQEGLFTMAEAIRKMTSAPCVKAGIKMRGAIKKGYYADLVIFDPSNLADRATYKEPTLYPAGIEWVIVNGRITVEKGAHTGARAGRVISAANFKTL